MIKNKDMDSLRGPTEDLIRVYGKTENKMGGEFTSTKTVTKDRESGLLAKTLNGFNDNESHL